MPSSQITGVSLPHFLEARLKVRVPSHICLLAYIILHFARLSIGTVTDSLSAQIRMRDRSVSSNAIFIFLKFARVHGGRQGRGRLLGFGHGRLEYMKRDSGSISYWQ